MVLSKNLKIAICFGLIMGAILSLCNLCFAAETEDVSFSTVNNLGTSEGSFVYNSNNEVKYFLAESGYKYTIVCHYNFTVARVVVSSASAPAVGVSYNSVYNFTENGQVFEFTVPEDTYVAIDVNFQDGYLTVEREELSSGLSGFVTDLSLSLSVNELSIVWNYTVPILAISVLFGLGFYLLKRLINRIKRAKGGV